MKKGFTLAELLVVVLIIGVLAAVAVPVYTGAVDRSRFAGLIPSAKALKDAQERIYFSNAQYTSSVADLDLSLPGEIVDGGKFVNDKEVFLLDNSTGNSASKNAILANNSDLPNVNLVMYLAQSPNFADNIHCEALEGDKRANRVCQSQGATEVGTRDSYKVYLMSGSSTGQLNSWPRTEECQTNAKWQDCSRSTNEDGSYSESFIKNGIEMNYHYDKDGNVTYANQNITAQGMFVEAWFENGVRVKQTQTYEDKAVTFYYDENGVKLGYDAVDPEGNKLQSVEYNPDGSFKNQYAYENNEIRQHNSFDENGVQQSTVVYRNDGSGTVQYYNQYENGEFTAQTKYHPDGSVRGYYTIVDGVDSGEVAVEYNEDGSIRISTGYTAPGQADKIYTYNPDGTWVSKPVLDPTKGESSSTSTDESTWGYGTYTVGNNGDVTRSDGVVIPGSGNYQNLCTAHPDQAQCAG